MEQLIQLPFDLDLPPSKMLRAGALSCMYETGNIRYISLGKTELVKKIFGAVRYEDWATLPYQINDEKITVNETGFFISYTAIYQRDIKNIYKASFEIEGKADNSISFSMKGIALADFRRNRIGICIHHPIKECRGRKATITRPDGTFYQSVFPELVSAELPFLDMSQLQWITEDHITVELTLEGDVFETEDQRNWSDSSYKTYSTRSGIPKPVAINAGDTIEQKVIVKISGTPANAISPLKNQLREVKIPFPQIGYGRSVNGALINDEILEYLIKIPFDHYRVVIAMDRNDWMTELQQALAEASQINTRLELAVFFSDDFKKEMLLLINQLKEEQLLVQSILVLQHGHNATPHELLQYIHPISKVNLPAIKIGYGTDAIFVDVNQNRPDQTPFDFISFGIYPQAHAFDNRSILENLQNQCDIIETARHFSGDQPIFISPITLKDRHSGADERQYSSLAALWTLITLQNFSEAYSITFYELFGASGILQTGSGNNKTTIIKPSPVYEAFSKIYQFQPAFVVKRYIGEEVLMDGLLLENEKGARLFFRAPKEYLV